MEVASYRILSAAAAEAGETEIQRVCEEILEEEGDGKLAAEHMPTLTRTFLRRDAEPEATAKH